MNENLQQQEEERGQPKLFPDGTVLSSEDIEVSLSLPIALLDKDRLAASWQHITDGAHFAAIVEAIITSAMRRAVEELQRRAESHRIDMQATAPTTDTLQ